MDQRQLLTGVLVIGIIAFLTAGGAWYSTNQAALRQQQQVQEQRRQNTNAPQDAAGGTMPDTATMGMYQDGEYMAVGSYTSPGGGETIDVTLTLQDNIVTAVEVTPNAKLPISKKYQGQFIEGYKELVLGKNIDEVELDVVSGSSLTPIGFENALEQIKAEAQAAV